MPEPTVKSAPQVLLAFDFGTRRIGVASGDTLTRTARSLTTLDAARGIPWPKIDGLVSELAPAQFVVGLPYNVDGTPTRLTKACRRFGGELKARYRHPVALVDERMSSRDAAAELKAARAQGLKRRRTTHADIDRVAAKVLAERWLEAPAAAENL